MAWFNRSKKSTYGSRLYMNDATAQRQQQKEQGAGLKFRYVEKTDGKTYVTYDGDDQEKAKAFLREEPVADDNTYIVVVTPDGTWGTDSSSLYLEKLRPWQRDTGEADCTGKPISLVDGFHNYGLAARGIVDNFLVEVRCGRCQHLWIDGIRFDDLTVVRCPDCDARNRVDSSSLARRIQVR